MAKAKKINLDSVTNPELRLLLKKYKKAVELRDYESECGFGKDEEKAERSLHRREVALVVYLNRLSLPVIG